MDQVPPHNIQAEQAVLAAMMINPDCRPFVVGKISSEDFYRESHALLFPIVSSNGLDVVGIYDEMQKQGIAEKCGGKEYLFELSDIVSTSAGWDYHSGIVKELSLKRKLSNFCSDTAQKINTSTQPYDEIIINHLESIKKLIPSTEQDYKDNRRLVKEVYDLIEERSKNENKTVGLLTGYVGIDSNLMGIEPKCTYYIKAERSTGKSALALNIGENITDKYPGYVLYFTLESTATALMFRRFARETRIALTRIRTGNIKSDGEWEEILKASNKLYENSMIIIENSRFRWFELMRAFCESFVINNTINLIIVDFLQLMRSKVSHTSRHLEMSYISDSFNFLAKDLNCPIMILSQVNQDYQTKESRDIENNADNVWELRREDRESENAELIAQKGKDSGTWKTEFRFDRFIQRFYDDMKHV